MQPQSQSCLRDSILREVPAGPPWRARQAAAASDGAARPAVAAAWRVKGSLPALPARRQPIRSCRRCLGSQNGLGVHGECLQPAPPRRAEAALHAAARRRAAL
eukprot:365321-Chlamydomonas_euryale.AAC.8